MVSGLPYLDHVARLSGTFAFLERPSLADWVRWVGVGVSVVGAFVTAANGVRLAARRTGGILTGLREWLRAKLPSWIPGARRENRVQAGDNLAMLGELVTAHVTEAWNDKARLKVKVQRLHAELEVLKRDFDQLRSEMVNKTSEVSSRIDALDARFTAEIARLEGIIRQEENDSARADARGLIPVAIGIVMAGLPDGLSDPRPLGWAVIALAMISTALVTKFVLESLPR